MLKLQLGKVVLFKQNYCFKKNKLYYDSKVLTW